MAPNKMPREIRDAAEARPDSTRHEVSIPTDEEIAKLAYARWEARGGTEGSAEEDWLAAEAELREEASRAATI